MRPWEIKLTKKEKEGFQRILADLVEENTAICPHPKGASAAVPENYCGRMCGVLFPSLEQRRVKLDYKACECPCYTISRSHKIKVVRKLLAYNERR